MYVVHKKYQHWTLTSVYVHFLAYNRIYDSHFPAVVLVVTHDALISNLSDRFLESFPFSQLLSKKLSIIIDSSMLSQHGNLTLVKKTVLRFRINLGVCIIMMFTICKCFHRTNMEQRILFWIFYTESMMIASPTYLCCTWSSPSRRHIDYNPLLACKHQWDEVTQHIC